MEISGKLLKFKFHILVAGALSLVIFSLIYVVPSFLDVLAYFWPLLLSTALFLLAVVVFGKTSPQATEAACQSAGEGILQYVAGRPEEVQQHAVEESSKPEQTTM